MQQLPPGFVLDSPAQRSGPRTIPGTGPKPPSPAEQERLGMERTRLDMARQDQARQNEQGALTAQNTQLDIAKKEREAAAGDTAEAIEAERKAAAFYLRALGSNRDYEAQDIGPRSWAGQKMADNAPDVLNSLPAFIGNSPERQISDSAQDAFIAASLRQDSGAAIPPEELERQRRIYFPMPGDGPDVIKAKTKRRQEALVGLKMASGRLGDNAEAEDAALAGRRAKKDYRPDRDEIVLGMDLPGSQTDDVTAMRISPANEAAYTAFLRASAGDPSFSAEKANSFLHSLGEKGSIRMTPEFVDAVRKGEAFSTDIDYSSADAARNAEIEALAKERYGDDPTTRASLLLKGASLNLSDEGAGIAGGIFDTLTGGSFKEGYERERDIERHVQKGSRKNYGMGWEIGGGFLTPVGSVSKAKTVGEFAKEGAKLGAVAGYGEGEGAMSSAANALLGAGAGSLIGAGVGKGSQKLAERAASKAAQKSARNALLTDFAEQGIDALPANVGGAPTRIATSGAGQALLSSGSIRDAVNNQADQFGEAVARNAQKAGSIVSPDEAGMIARKAGERFSAKTSQRGSVLYDRAEAAAGDVKIVPQQAMSEIDAKVARLAQSPDDSAQALAKELMGLKERFAKGVSIVGLRDARTRLAQGVYDGKLRSTADQKVYRDILGKVSDDIETGLRDAGKSKVAGMFKTADRYWTDRVDYIDEVLEPVIGKNRAGEAVLQSIESMATGKGGGVVRLSGLMRSLSNDERGQVQATIIDRLGKATKGNQNAEGDAFSANTFLTNWSALSEKGKAALFGDGELRKSLDQLARVGGNMKDVSRYTNTSNTSGALGWQAFISGATGMVSYPAAVLAGAGQYITGKMLASPKFAAWLARAPKNMTPAAAEKYFGRLRGIAASEPAIAGDVSRFAQFMNAANDASPGVAVASPEGQDKNN